MSSHGYVDECPNCGSGQADYCNENKPFTFTTISCLECGFYTIPKSGQMSLEDINIEREDRELNPLASRKDVPKEMLL